MEETPRPLTEAALWDAVVQRLQVRPLLPLGFAATHSCRAAHGPLSTLLQALARLNAFLPTQQATGQVVSSSTLTKYERLMAAQLLACWAADDPFATDLVTRAVTSTDD